MISHKNLFLDLTIKDVRCPGGRVCGFRGSVIDIVHEIFNTALNCGKRKLATKRGSQQRRLEIWLTTHDGVTIHVSVKKVG